VNMAINPVSSGAELLASKRLSVYEEWLWFIQFAMSQSAVSYLSGLQHPIQIMLAFTSETSIGGKVANQVCDLPLMLASTRFSLGSWVPTSSVRVVITMLELQFCSTMYPITNTRKRKHDT
jgi:hypothetical protein